MTLSNHNAGQTPTISFKVTNDAGEPYRDLSVLNRLAFAYSGPTTDYTAVFVPTAVGGGAAGSLMGPDGEGVFQYTPATGIPADASGTWAIGAEARQEVELTSSVVAEEAAVNPVVTFSVDDSEPEPHRVIVENMNCARCHGDFSKDFSIHGNLRNQVEYCEICHNSTQSDASRRRRDPMAVAAGEENATIDFKVMIHKIHTGEELAQQPYIIYGFGPPPQNYTKHAFGEVRYSGDRRLCDTCHVEDSQLIPPYPSTALPTLRTMLDPATGNSSRPTRRRSSRSPRCARRATTRTRRSPTPPPTRPPTAPRRAPCAIRRARRTPCPSSTPWAATDSMARVATREPRSRGASGYMSARRCIATLACVSRWRRFAPQQSSAQEIARVPRDQADNESSRPSPGTRACSGSTPARLESADAMRHHAAHGSLARDDKNGKVRLRRRGP